MDSDPHGPPSAVDAQVDLSDADIAGAMAAIAPLRVRVAPYAWPALIVLLGVARASSGAEMSSYEPIIYLVSAVASFLVLRYLTSPWRQASRMPEKARHFRVRVEDAGVTMEGADGSTTLKWSAFVDYRTTESHFLLGAQNGVYCILPRRVLGPNGPARLESLLSANPPSPAPPMPNAYLPTVRIWAALIAGVLVVYWLTGA